MSKKVYAGADIIFDGTTDGYGININTAEEFGDNNYIHLSDSINPIERMHIIAYINNIGDGIKAAYPRFSSSIGYDITATDPYKIPTNENVTVRLMEDKFYIIDSVDADIPDVLYDLLFFNSPDDYEITMSTMINTDGSKQDVLSISVNAHTVETTTIYPTTILESNGFNDDAVELNKNARGHYFLTMQESVSCNLYLKWFGTETPIKQISYKSSNYPHKPIIEQVAHNGIPYIRVTTNVPAHGNIYFNGGAEPVYTYITNRVAPYTAEIKIDKPGAYTANIISEVIMGESTKYFAYGELSDTLIVETQNVECTLSFNEYTATISCVPDIEGSVEKFTLQKQNGSEWINVSENTIGEFRITEDGTYKIIPTFGILYTGTVFPESITVTLTINTPAAYSDPAFPSQLGFDEVENANMYDIYRVNEDGDDELVATISPNNIISRIMRKEKMFIVIPNDEVRNV